jgi:hypothetical protein
MFSVFGGVAYHGSLWRIDKQPLLLPFGVVMRDTLTLSRRLTAAPMVGLNATYYSSANLGFTAEAVYLALRTDDNCVMQFTNLDLQNRNTQVCNDITQRTRTSSNAGFTLGVAYRLAPRSPVTPYGRLQAGASIRSSNVINMAGRFNETDANGNLLTQERTVILDETETRLHPLLIAAVGLTFSVSPGYQLRMEVRDHVIVLRRPTGPANDLARADVESFLGHAPALVFGIDIVLEQRRGRRY